MTVSRLLFVIRVNISTILMFRRKRTYLAKRLWKARVRGDRKDKIIKSGELGEGTQRMDVSEEEEEEECATCCCLLDFSDEDILKNSVLKHLTDNQLELLVEAVESGGSRGVSTCILIPGDIGAEGMIMCCQLFRWPDLRSRAELRRTPYCSTIVDPIYNCCNPYHWSRLCTYASPSSHSTDESDQKFKNSFYDDGNTKENEWCKIAYWELTERVGRLYSVEDAALDVFWTDMQADGLSLEALADNHLAHSDSVRRNRSKIGLGITLSLESNGVWVYNRSQWPIFLNSPSLEGNDIGGRMLGRKYPVYRVPAGHCFRIFIPESDVQGKDDVKIGQDFWGSGNLRLFGPVDRNSVRISFAKGWGPQYTRQEITACPTWLEVLLSPCR